jgi:hypothetical protein
MFNLTLLIQALNFLIAYWILATFLLKPILNQINATENQNQLIHNLIASGHSVLKDAEFKKKQLWQQTCSQFGSYLNFCKSIGIKPKAINKNLLPTQVEMISDLDSQKELVNVLVNKIISMQ